MKKYLISGFNTVQDVKLEAGTYTLVAYAKSMYGNVYTFALGDGVTWTEYDIDVVKGQLCKVWLTFTIDEKVTKFKPIANNFTESLPVYVTDLQLTKGNIPVEAGASPFDIDKILNDLHDEIDGIEDFTNEAFADGLLNREEKTQLRASLDAIGSIVESVKGSYDKLLDNPFISDNTMASITSRYYDFIASWISDGDPRGLKPVILWIVNDDDIINQDERDEKDRALNAFNDALYAYNQAEKEVYNDIGENSVAPVIINGNWAFWDSELQEFVESEFSAEGDNGHSPYIDILTLTWWEWDATLGRYKDTGINAEGKDAIAPIIIDGFWAFWDDDTKTFIKSTFSAIGDDGHSPEIRDGYWWEWNPDINDYQNTGVKAEGKDGEGGLNVMITTQGSFRTYWRQIGSQGQVLSTPEKISEIIGGVTIGGIKYVQCKVLIYKGSVDVTASALADPTTLPKWYLNNQLMSSTTDTLNIPISHADGVDDEIRFEYTDTNAKNWEGV